MNDVGPYTLGIGSKPIILALCRLRLYLLQLLVDPFSLSCVILDQGDTTFRRLPSSQSPTVPDPDVSPLFFVSKRTRARGCWTGFSGGFCQIQVAPALFFWDERLSSLTIMSEISPCHCSQTHMLPLLSSKYSKPYPANTVIGSFDPVKRSSVMHANSFNTRSRPKISFFVFDGLPVNTKAARWKGAVGCEVLNLTGWITK